MKRYFLIFCAIIMLLSGCAQQEKTVPFTNDQEISDSETRLYQKITAEEAKAIINAEDVIVLDVRTGEEYQAGHIEGSVLLSNTEIKEKAHVVLPDKNAKILIYCRSGNRSAQAAKLLLEMGYTDIYDFGGIIDWPHGIVQ